MLCSPCVIIDAIALCSAQNPIPPGASIQTPTWSLPLSVSRAQPTSPTVHPCAIFLEFTTARARSINSSFVMEQNQTIAVYIFIDWRTNYDAERFQLEDSDCDWVTGWTDSGSHWCRDVCRGRLFCVL